MRTLVRGFGQLLITLGVVILLFCVYELFWTSVATRAAQRDLGDSLAQRWANDPKAPSVQEFDVGDGLGILRIPRLGASWSWVVVEGVKPDALKDGPGHYPKSAMPGKVGNFAVAGHRATNGEPFAHLDAVQPGDRVVMETRRTTFTYRVRRTEITSPADTAVVAPVPGSPGAKPKHKRLTLTTCHPRWGSSHRLIVYGILDSAEPKTTRTGTTS